MKNGIVRIKTASKIYKLPCSTIEQAKTIVQEMTMTLTEEFTSVVIDNSGIIGEIMPNGHFEPFKYGSWSE